jgi:F-type H+-transporting ATPase subunit alpha
MDTSFNDYLEKTGEYGVVQQVSHPIVFVEGLPNVKTHEVILFETGQKAEVFSINRGKVEARTFSHEPVRVGTKVTRTNELLSIPVGKELLGHTVNPLGEPLDPSIPFTKPKQKGDLDAKPAGISARQKITKHLTTGVSLVDLLLPLGVGQRELVIGDRKTGKTSLLMNTIKTQVIEGNIAIYAAIAKKKSDIKKIQEFFIQEKIMDRIVIVASSSYDSPSLIYQTPYAAMAVAEYFKEQGTSTLLILDDLSSHAKFYRELSLLARRFPGRDSYPGDIFYVHSKLLERAGNFKHPTAGEVAISCLPVMEIVEGDLTGYVSTNVMGITDGHLYFDTNIYYEGLRPAINIPLSVTRVGRQTLDHLSREINKNLTAFLGEYDKLQNLSHFGQELTDEVKNKLRFGEMIYRFFNQPYKLTVPSVVQIIILSMILQNLVADNDVVDTLRTGLIDAYYHRETKDSLMQMVKTDDLKVFNENVMNNKDQLLSFATKK